MVISVSRSQAKEKQIVITYIGYQTQELTVTSGKALKVIMKEDAQAMDEVVVIGYTSKARKDLTGSVGSVSGVKIAAIPVSSAAVALQGKIAGVQVTTVDGAPGADINIRVRGGTSVTQSNEPLLYRRWFPGRQYQRYSSYRYCIYRCIKGCVYYSYLWSQRW